MLANAFKDMIVHLKSMAHTAEAIADGDLRNDIAPKSEKDVLGSAFKKMIEGLRGIISEMREGSDQIASASCQIAATAEQSAKSNEMSATAVEEVTSTVHELSQQISRLVKKTRRTNHHQPPRHHPPRRDGNLHCKGGRNSREIKRPIIKIYGRC